MKISIRGPIVSDGDKWIYNWFNMPAVSPGDVRTGLEKAGSEDVELEIASNGGYVTSAIEIYQALKDYPGKVTAKISYACSAATVIACAADESEISEVGFFMIHNAGTLAEGNKHVMSHEAEVLDTIDAGIISAYENKTGMSREDIQSLMDKDTYMSAEDAVSMGFVDGLIPNAKQASTDDVVQKAVAVSDGMIPTEAVHSLAYISKCIENMTGSSLTDWGKLDHEPPAVEMTREGLERQISGEVAGSDNNPWKGENTMGLQEIMAEHPEISNEIEEMTAAARAEGLAQGIAQERERMNSLDAIAGRVSAEALHEAKYGEEPIDGKTLAFKAMQEDAAKGAAYMANAKEDSQQSGGEDVGVGDIDAGEDNKDDEIAKDMADYVNARKER